MGTLDKKLFFSYIDHVFLQLLKENVILLTLVVNY